MQEKLNNAIADLSNDIPAYLTKDCGLFTGDSGAALFFAYQFKATNNQVYLDQCFDIIESSFDSVADKYHQGDFSLSNGASGFLWLLHHLIHLGLLTDDNGCSEQLDPHIRQSIDRDFGEKNYDLMYKMIGKGVYFLEKAPDEFSMQAISTIVDRLDSMKKEDPSGVYWDDTLGKNLHTLTEHVQSLGLAHGIPSIIVFLSKVNSRGIAKTKTEALVSRAISWLLKRELVNADSYFSNMASTTKPSRLSWCYGDLGVAISLFHAAETFGNDVWYNHALRIAIKTAHRDFDSAGLHLHNSGYFDPCFCHGTIGIAHMFKRFYEVTNREIFDERHKFWIEKTLDLKKYRMNGIGGYLRFSASKDSSDNFFLEKDNGLLNGTAGIGLGLLSAQFSKPLRWDKFFLTDIER